MANVHTLRQKEDSINSSKQRCELILHNEYRCAAFNVLNINDAKRTFCYLMQYHINIVSAYCNLYGQIHPNIINKIYEFYAIQHFIKILEDQTQLQPIAFAKKLMQNDIYKQALQNDILIPEFAGDTTDRMAVHKYEIVQYQFVPHVTLQSIAFRMFQTKQLNPMYFLQTGKITPWKSRLFKLKMLYIFKRVIEIVIDMNKLQLIDLDISADNFIIKTMTNARAQWNEIIPENCFKIDHESVIEFTNNCLYAYQMNKPMKPHCTPPEISGYIIQNYPYNMIKVEPFTVYQIGSIFIMILFGQVYKNGVWHTLGADHVNNAVIDQELNWSPKNDIFPDDLTFLSDCMSISPSKRPSLGQLLQYVFRSIEITKSKNKIPVGNYLPKKVTRKINNLHVNGCNRNYNTHNDGRVRIIHQRQSQVNVNRGRNNNQYNRIQTQRNNHSSYERRGRFQVIKKPVQQQQGYYTNDDGSDDEDEDDYANYNIGTFSNNTKHKPRRNNF